MGFRSAGISEGGPELDVFVDQKSDAFFFFLVSRWLLSIPGSLGERGLWFLSQF